MENLVLLKTYQTLEQANSDKFKLEENKIKSTILEEPGVGVNKRIIKIMVTKRDYKKVWKLLVFQK